MSPAFGAAPDAMVAYLRRVATLTPDEALMLTRGATDEEGAGRGAAVRRAEAALAARPGPVARDVQAGVWAAFLAAREGPAWRAAWDRVFAMADPRRRADAAGALLATTWDTEQILEQTAAALALGARLGPADRDLVLAPWRALADAGPTRAGGA